MKTTPIAASHATTVISTSCGVFSAHGETLNLPGNPDAVSGQEAAARVVSLIGEWHPALRWLVQTTDMSTVTAFSVKTSVPIRPWPTQRVTLIGDALHNMTPFRGIGANTALRDAEALHQCLAAVAGGETELMPVLAAYERDMIEYGFRAVRTSLKEMKRLHARSPVSRLATRAFFRIADLS